MHEIKIMQNVVSILEEQISSPEIGEVRTIFLEVGKLRYIIPDIMITGFKNIPKSKKLEKAELEIKEVPVRVKCLKCDDIGEISPDVFKCPSCGSDDVEMVSGDELIIKGIEW